MLKNNNYKKLNTYNGVFTILLVNTSVGGAHPAAHGIGAIG